eukprot:12906814-Prorocentrum_lima.AAC.1
MTPASHHLAERSARLRIEREVSATPGSLLGGIWELQHEGGNLFLHVTSLDGARVEPKDARQLPIQSL